MNAPFKPKDNREYIEFIYKDKKNMIDFLSSNEEIYRIKSDEKFTVDQELFEILKKIPFEKFSVDLKNSLEQTTNIDDFCEVHKNFFASLK